MPKFSAWRKFTLFLIGQTPSRSHQDDADDGEDEDDGCEPLNLKLASRVVTYTPEFFPPNLALTQCSPKDEAASINFSFYFWNRLIAISSCQGPINFNSAREQIDKKNHLSNELGSNPGRYCHHPWPQIIDSWQLRG